MAIEQTLSILKPDAVAACIIDDINSYIKKSGLKIVAQKMISLTRRQVESFYEVHKDRHFFSDLVEFMISGPVIVQVLIGENAVSRYRSVIGATDPKQAERGTIRGDFANDVSRNIVHGSDSVRNARREIGLFFPNLL